MKLLMFLLIFTCLNSYAYKLGKWDIDIDQKSKNIIPIMIEDSAVIKITGVDEEITFIERSMQPLSIRSVHKYMDKMNVSRGKLKIIRLSSKKLSIFHFKSSKTQNHFFSNKGGYLQLIVSSEDLLERYIKRVQQ